MVYHIQLSTYNYFKEGVWMSSKNKKRKNSNYGYINNTPREKDGSDKSLQKRKYPIKRKIPLTILLSLAAPLTICFFGPFEMYCGNIQEFLFSLGDFFPFCVLVTLAAASVLFVFLMLLDGVGYDIGCAVIVWLSIMFFAQRYYLNLGINALMGDGVGITEANPEAVALNTVIWIAAGAAVICAVLLLKKKNVGIFFVSSALVMIALIGAQAVGFATLSFSSDAYTPVTDRMEQKEEGDDEVKEPKVLTFENITELSDDNNVVFFLIDRFDVKYYEKLLGSEPDFFDGLDGFTFYNDYTSLYCRTYPAVASILTGYENDFEDTRLDYFKEIYTDGGHLRNLYDNGYDVNVYTEKFYAYDDAAYMSEYTDNTSGVEGYYIDSKAALLGDMLRLSLSEYLPFVAKNIVGYMSTPDFNAHAIYETEDEPYDSDMKAVYDHLENNEFSTVDSDGQFNFIHIYGCHTPIKYDLDWEEANEKEKYDTTMALKQSFMIIYKYIEEMKRLGVYDNATIVITGDHPAAISDTKLIGQTGSSSDNGTRVTAMLLKRSGESGTELKTSTAQVSQDQLWATIYESEGLLSEKTGESFFDISEGEERVRRYLFELSVYIGDERADEIVEYEITGTARDPENWKIKGRKEIGRIYK